jgi:imidazolonepropionase-like amidohydrolase
MKFFNNNRITQSIFAAGLLLATQVANAQSFAITNATVHTASAQGVLKNAVVVVTDGVISAINPATVTADQTIDAKGKVLTPGFIATMTQIGLVEVGAVASTRDGGDEKAEIDFDPSLAFNPKSTLIPYTRQGGITTTIAQPYGSKGVFKGQIFAADLSGEFDTEINANLAVYVSLGGKSKGSRALSLQSLTHKLEDRQKAMDKKAKAKAKAKDKAAKDDKKDDKEPSREDTILSKILSGEKPLVVGVNRGADILQVLKLKQRFGLNLVISGAGDSISVSSQLAAAKVPVIINPTSNLPRSFDSLHANLDIAAKLIRAGVKVIFTESDGHNAYQLRFLAGNAISYGVKPEDALAALTSNVASTFGLDSGSIEVGKPADLVLWHGDMFDMTGSVDTLWIDGEATSLKNRSKMLKDRYRSASEMPPAYN